MTTIKLGTKMVTIPMERVEENIWCSNLAVKKVGKLISEVGFVDNDGVFKKYEEGTQYLHVLGFGESGYHDSPLANLMRLMCMIVKDRVEQLVVDRPVDVSQSFVNGGMLGNGNLIEEVIIYRPYIDHKGELSQYQAIFSLFPSYRDTNSLYESRRLKMKLNNEDRWVEGIRMQEDGSPRMFTAFAGTLDVRLSYEHEMEWVMRHWREDARPEGAKYAVGVYMRDFMQYCECLARMIHTFYFDGKTYTQYRDSLVRNLK